MTALTLLSAEFLYHSAPFPSCHASTLVETRQGSLLAAWFGGTHESAPDVAIYLARHGRTGWSAPEKVAIPEPEGNSCYNPVLFQPRKGPLMLFYKVGTGPQTWWGMLTTSSDDGKTWSRPQRLPEGIFGPIKNKPVELPDGTILCGSSEELGGWRVHMEFTRDYGQTWTRTAALNDSAQIGAIQPSLLALGGSRWLAIGRTQQSALFSIESADHGQTWGPMSLLDLPNPNSGTDAVRLRDGRYLLVYNHTAQGRSPLNVAISPDGKHWERVLDLETEPGEFSYPAVIQTRDGKVHITYTWNRVRIRHAVLTP